VEDQELLASFADQAGLALDRAQAVVDREELAVISDRERIARDLHDTVIQRLFATGLSLQGAARLAASNPEVASRLESAVDDLDLTVKHIRTAIFGLESARRSTTAGGGLRAQVLALAGEASGSLGFEPRVLFDGPVDSEVSSNAGAELVTVLREALSNAARHAGASSVDVEVVVAGDEVRLVVRDDGRGFDPSSPRDRGLGLRNMRTRAERLGGGLELRSSPDGSGTTLEWRAPRRPQPAT
jgi:signal transduction histidine kinase